MSSNDFSLNAPHWVINYFAGLKNNEFNLSQITQVQKNSYTIQYKKDDVKAELNGKLLYTTESPLDYPTVGDWVYVQYYNQNTLAIIHGIIPRKTVLKRKIAGKDFSYQLIAANIDIALIVQSLDQDYNRKKLERYIAISRDGRIVPLVLLSKCDLLSEEELNIKVSTLNMTIPDIQVIPFSNKSPHLVKKITDLLRPGMTYCLLGSSGVGKTTLLNHILEKDLFKTQEVRRDGKGKHTTTHRQLIYLENGVKIIDTPGMRELGLTDSQKGINQTFNEILKLSEECYFNNCTHTQEDGCAVLAALSDGTLSLDRYQNFLKMKKEADHYQMSYAEKRLKDKKTGKMYKNILKNHTKRKGW